MHRSQSRAVAVAAKLAAAGCALLGSGALPPPTTARAAPAPSARIAAAGSDWLGEINRYRLAAGVPPVVEQPAWEAGLLHHLTYLGQTPASYFTGSYVSRHTENPASPYYTPDGALEAGSSNIGGGSTPAEAIDGWLAAPFHAIGILRRALTQTELGFDPGSGSADLDVIRGLNGSGAPYALPLGPVLFPGPGMTTDLLSASDESPSPLETCGWTGDAGLPLIALLDQAPDPALTATLSGPGGPDETSANGGLCVVDAHTYKTTDPTYGPTGRAILSGDRALVLVPRRPLTNGTYRVTIAQPQQPDVAWSFSAYIPPPANTRPPTILGTPVAGTVLRAGTGTWTGSPTAYASQWDRCDAVGERCGPIAGAVSSTYKLSAADVGHAVRVLETATNAGGTGGPATSAPTGAVRAAPVALGFVRLLSGGVIKVTGRTATFKIGCHVAPTCTGSATLDLGGRHVAHRSFVVANHGVRTLRFVLPAASVSALRRRVRRRSPALIAVSARHAATVTRRFTLAA